MPYCDNITVVGKDKAEVSQWRDKLLAEFRRTGFGMHEISETSSFMTVLGADLGGDSSPSVIRTRNKMWLLALAFRWLASGPFVSGKQVEVLLGHLVAATMFNRAGLSIPRALYNFVRDKYAYPAKLWDSCRYDAWVITATAMLLSSDLTLAWSETVTCTDASLSGMGVCVRKPSRRPKS